MKNVKIKLTVWAIILLAGIIFYWQNRLPEISLVIFGSETIALPVSLWLIIGAIAGFLTSIALQLLLGVYSGQRRRSREWDDQDNDGDEGDFEFPEATESPNERFASSTRFNADRNADSVPNSRQQEELPEDGEEDWESPLTGEDWNDLDDEWNIEEPPKRESNPPPPGNFYEVQNRPEKTSQQGSVYSYRYRQANGESDNSEPIEEEENDNDDDEEPNQSPNVYEANYRVIRPPLWNLPDAEENSDEEADDTDKR
ncbi:MAG: hypothetical protein BRC33_02360 [Cyanobacteria bacterium SW_9_44_58]|nr:MAG: hypothetical protein BRC33_02360 [Cyanobacteria bacterium SW_9_44_58]